MFLGFVVHKMRQRVRLGCCGIGEGAQAENAAVLALARQLYRAAAANPATKPRPLAVPAGWGLAPSAAYLPPTVAPGEMATNRSPRLSAASAAHLSLVPASPPWSQASEFSATVTQQHDTQQQERQLQQPLQQLPPRPPRPLQPSASPSGTVRDSSVPTHNRQGSCSAAQGGEFREAHGALHLPHWPAVQGLVSNWSRSRSGTRGAEPSSRCTGDSVPCSGAAVGNMGQYEHAAIDLEAQTCQALCPPPEARVFTWSQLGILPGASLGGSHRTLESAGLLTQAGAAVSVPRTASQVHAVSNPVFDPCYWARPGTSSTGAVDATNPSFLHQMRRQHSQPRPAASSPYPAADPALAAELAAVAAPHAWGRNSEQGSQEGNIYRCQRWSQQPVGPERGRSSELEGAGMRSHLPKQ